MNVLIIGARGKMGSLTMEILKKDPIFTNVYGFDQVEIVNLNIYNDLESIPKVDVIIDFSSPKLIHTLLNYAVKHKSALIIATTGYTSEEENLIRETSQIIPIFKSSNFSYGIALISEVLALISSQLETDFDIEIIDKHHNQKKDAPSGTALHLAKVINSSLVQPKEIVNGNCGLRKDGSIPIHAIRAGSIVGDHQVIFAGDQETIEINHFAQSKTIFVKGVIKAALFIYNQQPGFYDMKSLFVRSKK